VTKVEVDEVLGFCMIVSLLTSKRARCQSKVSLTVCDKAAKVPANNAMPCCALSLVELYIVSIRLEILATLRLTVRLMWWAISYDGVSQAILALLYDYTAIDTNLLDCVLLHRVLGCFYVSTRVHG